MRAVLITIGVLLSVAILEISLRLIQYEGARERSKLSSRFNPYYSSPLPALSAFPSEDGSVNTSSSLSIHGQEIPLQKKQGLKRVLFIGDSGTYGSGVPFKDSFPFVFQTTWDRSNPSSPVEVINAGRRGLSTVGEIQLLEDELVALRPDIVVLGIFMANDINFNLAHAGVEHLSPAESAFLRSFYFLRRHSALCHFLYLRLLVLNTRYKLIERAELRATPWVPVEYRLIEPNGLSMVNYLHGEIASYKVPFSPLMNQAWAVLEETLQEFVRLSTLYDFKPMAVIIPTSSTVAGRLSMRTFPNALSDLRRDGIRIAEAELDVGAAAQKTREICQTIPLSCVDPTDELARALGQASFLPNDDHLSTTGHKIVGEFVATKAKALFAGASAPD